MVFHCVSTLHAFGTLCMLAFVCLSTMQISHHCTNYNLSSNNMTNFSKLRHFINIPAYGTNWIKINVHFFMINLQNRLQNQVHPLIHVIHLLVDQMLGAAQKMDLLFVNAYPNTRVIHMKTADQNVWSVQTAQWIKHVSKTNAKTHVQVLVDYQPFVQYQTTFQFVTVRTAQLEMHLEFVNPFQEVNPNVKNVFQINSATLD